MSVLDDSIFNRVARLLWLLPMPGFGVTIWKLWVVVYPLDPITSITGAAATLYLAVEFIGKAFGMRR